MGRHWQAFERRVVPYRKLDTSPHEGNSSEEGRCGPFAPVSCLQKQQLRSLKCKLGLLKLKVN